MKNFTWHILVMFSLIVSNFTFAQAIKGYIRDTKGAPIPNATIIVEKMNIGTVANSDGEYKINLQTGNYSLLFEALGYQSTTKDIVITNETVSLDIQLNDRVFLLNEVVVKNGEDPAYDIMRKAIALAPYHLNQIKSYTSNVYLRGSMEIKTIPWILRNQLKRENGILIKEGDVFAEESVNEIKFEAPDKYNQRVISIQSNIPDNTSPPIPNMKESFYSPIISGMISPLSPHAFKYYRFVYDGFSKAHNANVCKIKVIPRQASTELYAGDIYIVEDAWTLYSVNLSNENTFGTIIFKVMFTPLVDDAWMPVSYSVNAAGSIIGLSGSFSYNGSVTYSNVQVNSALPRPSLLKPFATTDSISCSKKVVAKSAKNQKFLNDLSKKEKITNGDMRKLSRIMEEESKAELPKERQLELKDNTTYIIEKDAKLKDSTYWNMNRPIPLTITEKKALQIDSTQLRLAKDSKDSIDGKPNKFVETLGKIAFGTNRKLGKDSIITIGYGGLVGFKQIQYNTVDGLAFRQNLSFDWQVDSLHKLRITPMAGYAFARKAFMWEVASNYSYAPLKRGSFDLEVGSQSFDYNQNNGIKPFVNSAYTLLGRQNYEKLLSQDYITLSNNIDIINGLVLEAQLSYSKNRTLENNTDYSFFYKDSREFTSNTPDNLNYNDLSESKSAIADISLVYTPFQYYRIVKGAKRVEYSKFPTTTLHYKKGFKDIASSNSDFDFLELGTYQWVDLSASRSIFYALYGGNFLNQNYIPFTDFKHFNTQPLEINVVTFINAYTLLDFYKQSSSDYFIEAHFQYASPYLLVKRIPFFHKKLWRESLYVKYLTNETIKNYNEVGYSINHLFLVANCGVFAGFENGKFREVGFRLGVGF